MIESTPGSSTALPEAQQRSRFEHLDALLTRAGYPHRQITGSYEGVVTKYSFLVPNKPGNPIEKFKQEMFSLGREVHKTPSS